MQMNSLKTIYSAALSVTLLFAMSNLFTVFAITAQQPIDDEEIRQTNNDFERRGQQDNAELTLGKPIERNLAGNEAHSYKIALAANQYLHVVVEQRGIDIVVALFAPDGKKIAEVDSPNGTQGDEPISIVAETAGNYRLEVRPLEKDAVSERYEVKIEDLREATTKDRNRIAARRLYLEAEKLRIGRTELRKALEKYEEALSLFRADGDFAGEALTLTDMGSAYRHLGENSTAIDYYNQAMARWQTVGNLGGEAFTLNYIGVIYRDSGEKQKAVVYYREALRRFRAVGGRSGEAEALFNIGVYEKERGDLISALSYCEAALDIIESLRANFGNDTLRGTYFIPMPDFYEFYIDLLMQLHKQQPLKGFDTKALQVSERARARSLLETLAEANADIRQGVDPVLLEREHLIQQSLAGKSERLTRISNDEKLKAQKPAAEKEVNELLVQYQEVEAQIRVKSPLRMIPALRYSIPSLNIFSSVLIVHS